MIVRIQPDCRRRLRKGYNHILLCGAQLNTDAMGALPAQHKLQLDRGPIGLIALGDMDRRLDRIRVAESAGDSLQAKAGQGEFRHTGTLDPLGKKPSEVATRLFLKGSLQITPISYRPKVLFRDALQRPPKCRIAHFLSQRMKDHGGFLIADGIVFLIALLRKPPERVPFAGTHIDGIAQQHQPPLFTSLSLVAGQFVIVVIRQVGRQPFHPVAPTHPVEHPVADPGMHDLMPQGVRLRIVALDDPAPQQRKGRHAQSAREKIFDDGKL